MDNETYQFEENADLTVALWLQMKIIELITHFSRVQF